MTMPHDRNLISRYETAVTRLARIEQADRALPPDVSESLIEALRQELIAARKAVRDASEKLATRMER